MISMIFVIDSSLKKKHCLKGKMDSRVEFFCFCECFISINNSFSFPTLSLEGFIWFFFLIFCEFVSVRLVSFLRFVLYDYEYMCSETDFTQEKSFSSNC